MVNSISNNRSIRIFLSSTFKDFQEERDLLVRQVFPALRKKLSNRFVDLVDVDLRWGITPEQAERGETLPVCLVEIDRARPFFIGMLGERYGWVPPKDAYPLQLLHDHEWLNGYIGDKSVTELEILHGVLNNPDMTERAFFYFRSAAYAINKGSDYLPQTRQEAELQKALKAQIKQSAFPVINYRNPQSFAKRLEKDLWKILNEAFPVDEVPDAFSRDQRKHEAYANPRRKLYLGGEQYIAQIEKALSNNEQRILIEGTSGAGKSALIANWVDFHHNKYPNDIVHVHYVAASADSADPFAIIFRLFEAIKKTTKSNESLENHSDSIFENFQKWLSIASDFANKNNIYFIIVFDALNGLSSLRDLRWFPEFIPSRVCFMVSCLPGDVLENLVSKGDWCKQLVNPLDLTQKQNVLVKYLGKYNKNLSKIFIDKIIEHHLTSNPLFLKTLAEELRLFGRYELLEKQLDKYLTSNTVDELFQHVLQRVEDDCGKSFVKNVLQTIWASRSGLNEKEILEINGLTPSKWATIRNALDESLLEVNGKINFCHDYLRLAIESRYLNSMRLKQEIHVKLAKWFYNHSNIYRQTEETPYQWLCAEDWSNLKEFLCDNNTFHVFDYLDGFDSDDYKLKLIVYWSALEANANFTIDKSYAEAWKKWESQLNDNDIKRLCVNLQGFLTFTGDYSDFNLGLAQLSVQISKNKRNRSLESFASNNLAHLHWLRGEYKLAEKFFRKLLIESENSPKQNLDSIGNYCTNLAVVLGESGEYFEAETLLLKSLDIAEKLYGLTHRKTWLVLLNLGGNKSEQDKLEEAEEILRRALILAENLFGPNHPDTALLLHHLAKVLYEKENNELAESYCRQALKIREKILGHCHPDLANSLDLLAQILHDNGDYKLAEQLYRRALSINEEKLGITHPKTAISLNNLADFLLCLEDFESAERLFKRVISIVETTFGSEHKFLASYFKNLGDTLYLKGHYYEAEFYYRKAINIVEKNPLDEFDNLGDILGNLGCSLSENDDYESAEPIFRQALELGEKKLGKDNPEIETTLFNLAFLLGNKGDYDEAEDLFNRLLLMAEKTYEKDSSQVAYYLSNLGAILKNKGDFENAKPIFQRALKINEKLNGEDDPETRETLYELAQCLNKLGDYSAAETLFRKELASCQKCLGNKDPESLGSLHNLGDFLFDLSRYDEAEKILRELISLREKNCNDSEDFKLLAESLFSLGRVLNSDDAIAVYQRAISILIEHFGKNHPATIDMKTKIDEINL